MGVPWPIIEAMLHIEGSGVFNLTAEEVAQYQKPGEKIPHEPSRSLYCNPNPWSAAGPAQMTTTGCYPFDTCVEHRDDTNNANCVVAPNVCSQKPDAWNQYKGTILAYQNDGRTPNVCNLKDAIFAGGAKLKNDSGTLANTMTEWSKAEVYLSAQRYYGSCTPCDVASPGSGAFLACQRLGTTYCDYVWNYYQEHKNDAVVAVPEGRGGEIIDLTIKIANACYYRAEPANDPYIQVGRVTASRRICLDTVSGLNASAREVLKESARRYVNGQCVAFAQLMQIQFTGSDFNFSGPIPVAADFATYVPYGYELITPGTAVQPHPGDYMIWTYAPAGHIAVVVEVLDQDRVRVADANVGNPDGQIQIRLTSYGARPGFAGWMTPKL